MNNYDIYISLIFVIKICFILLVVTHIYLKAKGQTTTYLYKKLVYWKERVQFVFILLMAFLLIYLFNPRNNKIVMIDGESNVLLFMFGFTLLLTAKWSVFFHEAKWIKYIQ
jgi:hypothetical protein